MEPALSFQLFTGEATGPRLGKVTTAHGSFDTPVFMPVGTAGTVKSLNPDQVAQTGARIVLGNTFHLLLKPGPDIVAAHGGLHGFMQWPHSILTDSGGFQVFSLSGLRKLDQDGVTFRSPLDGHLERLTPERAVEIQQALGSDIAMVLDVCPPAEAPRDEVRRAMDLSTDWAGRCLVHHRRPDQALFAIIQGGADGQLRAEHAQSLTGSPFDGFAIGGLSVGESTGDMYAAIEATTPHMPVAKPRYLMGVGTPQNLVEAVARGVDMFDCVLPTRTARNGRLYTSLGVLNISNARHAHSLEPLDAACDCYTCQHFSRAYLRHLFMARELLSYQLNSIHNLRYFQNLMAAVREAIATGGFEDFRRAFHSALQPEEE